LKTISRKELAVTKGQKWIADSLQYEVIMGSTAYGVSTDTSDLDIYGWCIPPKSFVFPHTEGYIDGLGPSPPRFEQFSQHHVKTARHEYDFTIYNLVKYVQLVAENNPNMIDSLFVPPNCVTHITEVGNMLRDRRKDLLHKGSWHKFKGYAYSQIHKIKNKEFNPNWTTKRKDRIQEIGFDSKQSYHAVRLIDEAEQILLHGDIDLQRNREHYKAIRRGDLTFDQVAEYFFNKERDLEKVYLECKLPHGPNWPMINGLVYDILEQFYGSISEVPRHNDVSLLLNDLEKLFHRYKQA
jgi:predicted nucleotidyltransferase